MYCFTVSDSCKLKMTLLQVHCLRILHPLGRDAVSHMAKVEGQLQNAARGLFCILEALILQCPSLQDWHTVNIWFFAGVNSNLSTFKIFLIDQSLNPSHHQFESLELSCHATNPAIVAERKASQASDRITLLGQLTLKAHVGVPLAPYLDCRRFILF